MLAISILNWNWLNDTIKCIDSILKSNFIDYKIFLLDNWSNDCSEYHQLCKLYKDCGNIIINRINSNLWFTWWNNYNYDLIKNSDKFDYFMLLNNDTIVESDFLQNFMDKIANFWKKWIFWPIIHWKDWKIQAIWSNINLWTGSSIRLKEIKSDFQEVDYITWACMIIPVKLIKKIWLLDDKFFAYSEESDFCLRAKKQWYLSYALDVSWIIHMEETANKKVKPYYTYLMFRNRILLLKKHSKTFQYLFSYIILIGYLIIIFPKRFWFENYKYAFKWIFDWIKWMGGPFKG